MKKTTSPTHSSHPVRNAVAQAGRFAQPPVPGWRWELLAGVEAVIIGVGAIGRLLAEHLFSLGVRRFVLVDPKRYRPASITQCSEDEIGMLKVRCAARWLVRAGARVMPWPTRLEFVEPGWVAGPRSFIVVCADTRSAVRVANRLALRMRRMLFKVNLETALLYSDVRSYDCAAAAVKACAECSWGSAEYASQETAVSCDDVGATARSTGSPRALSAFTAGFAAMTIVSALVDRDARRRLDGQALGFSALGPSFTRYALPGNPDCLADHRHDETLARLDERPHELSFEALTRSAGMTRSQGVRVSGSGQLVARGHCARCGEAFDGPWWCLNPKSPVARCRCGGRVWPSPFFSASSRRREELNSVWSAPLSRLGVGRKALVTLADDRRQASFVLG